MVRWALALALLTAACGKPRDYGACLASHHRGAFLLPVVIPTGKSIIVVPILQPAKEVCDRWQYPDGR